MLDWYDIHISPSEFCLFIVSVILSVETGQAYFPNFDNEPPTIAYKSAAAKVLSCMAKCSRLLKVMYLNVCYLAIIYFINLNEQINYERNQNLSFQEMRFVSTFN